MATQYTHFQGHGSSVMVHRDHVGFVIGRRYVAIGNVAKQTHTRIQVNDQDPTAPFVALVIGGRSVQDVMAAHQGVMELARRAEAATPRVGEMAPMNHFHCQAMNGFELRVSVAPEDVGMVLGSKGSTLKKTGSDTWTWIKFFKAKDQTPATFSIRGFLQRDVDEAAKRIMGIAQESYNRRTGGPRHHREGAMTMGDKAVFKMAPVPKNKRVSFKVKAKDSASSPTFQPFQREPRSMPVMPRSPSPTYTPTSPHTPPSA